MGLPWNRIFHELNLTPLINKMNELAQRVEQLASQIVTVNNPRITIKQGDVTKGSFTLNQSSAQTINLDAGGGGGSEYTAGDGITITDGVISVTNPINNPRITIKQGGVTKGSFTLNQASAKTIDLDAGGGGGGTEYTAGNGITIQNNVISVTNPINKTDVNFDDAVIPCLFQDNSVPDAVLKKEDGTDATLSDCLDLGESTLDIGRQFLRHWENVSFSGDAKVYDYGTQQQTVEQYSGSIADGTTQVYTLTYNLFAEGAQIIQATATVGNKPITIQIVIGKANGHLYACLINAYFGTLSEQDYISSCTLTADIEFTQI